MKPTSQSYPKTLLEYVDENVEPFLFEKPGENPELSRKKKNLRLKVLGPDTIGAITTEYSTLDICDKLNILPHQWLEMPLEERGKLMAYSILQNKIELVREFKRQQEAARKNAIQAHKKLR